MKTLYTEEQFSKTKSNDKLPLECEYCGKEFLKKKAYITSYLNGYDRNPNKYCSRKCSDKSKHNKIETNCKNCDKLFFKIKSQFNENGQNFCGQSCSASYNTMNRSIEFKKENAKKIKLAVNKYWSENKSEPDLVNRKCLYCKKDFLVRKKRKNQKYCSKECRLNCPLYRKNLSQVQLNLIANGTHKGWSSRTKLSSSYAEKFFEKVLSNNEYYKDVDYTRELKVDKYFVDFAFVDKKIALEIDGKQHLLPERIASDKLKDECLEKNGWYIIRIPWKSLRKEENKVYMKQQIDNLLERLKK